MHCFYLINSIIFPTNKFYFDKKFFIHANFIIYYNIDLKKRNTLTIDRKPLYYKNKYKNIIYSTSILNFDRLDNNEWIFYLTFTRILKIIDNCYLLLLIGQVEIMEIIENFWKTSICTYLVQSSRTRLAFVRGPVWYR